MPTLPDSPNLEWLRKEAKRRLVELRAQNESLTLADAQLALAREYGFSSWRALKAAIDARSVEGRLFSAARRGDTSAITELLDRHPGTLHARDEPYEHTLLHAAAAAGHLDAVALLLDRGIDPNVREKGDNTYPMHWAAADGNLDVVRLLADRGGDVIGSGDDHALEVIGWAACFGHHREVAEFLVGRGARHHIFSAIALDLGDEVRRIVHADPASVSRRMSRNENHQTPLHYAVSEGRSAIVALLLELGADPLAIDGSGFEPAAYAQGPEADRAIMEKIRALTNAELLSAERGSRRANVGARDLIAALALHDWSAAERLVGESPALLSGEGGALHLMAKRNEGEAVQWLLDHGADPNGRWAHWDATVVPLHLAVLGGHPAIVQRLLAAGADATIRDSKHDADAAGWAHFFLNQSRNRPAARQEVVKLLLGAIAESAPDTPEPDDGAQVNPHGPALFEEPFSDQASLARNWVVAPGMTVRRGVLAFDPPKEAHWFVGMTNRNDFQDCALTADVRIVRGAVGLVLRASTQDRYYMIQFDLDNDPTIVWFHTFTPDERRGYRLQRVRARHVPRAGEWHRMRVVAHRFRFDVFLGDPSGPLLHAASWDDPQRTYAKGAIGVWEHGGEAGEYRALRVDPLIPRAKT